MCKKSRRIMEFKYFYFEKYTEYYDFPAKTEDGSYLVSKVRQKFQYQSPKHFLQTIVQCFHLFVSGPIPYNAHRFERVT